MLLLNWFIKMFGDLPLLLLNVDYVGLLLLWMVALGWDYVTKNNGEVGSIFPNFY